MLRTARRNVRLGPGAGDVIARGHEEDDGQSEYGRDDDELGALGAVFGVHEEQDDERGFEDGDGQGDDDIQAGEKCIEVDLGGGDGEDRADHQSAEYGEVDFGRNYVFRHALTFLPNAVSGDRSDTATGTRKSKRYQRSASRGRNSRRACCTPA